MSEAALPAPESTEVSDVAKLPAQTEEESHQLIELVWRFFCSLRLTLANLLGLFLAMIAGTFVNPANDSLTNIEKAFGGAEHTHSLFGAQVNPILWSYRTFELYDLFHAWWFTLLLLSLALNLIACSIERLPRIWYLVRDPEKRLDRVQGIRHKGTGAFTRTIADVRDAFAKRGYSAEIVDGNFVFAERGRYARFGVWVVHISLLLILGGGVYGRLTAFEGTADVPQAGGEAEAMLVRKPDGSVFRKKLEGLDGTPFIVRCDDFRLKEFEPGRPKAFESDLRLFERRPDGSAGKLVARQTINVNQPLRYGGLTFYQASYRQLDDQQRARLAMTDKVTGAVRELIVGPGEGIDAAAGLRYVLTGYDPDFQGQGPALQVVRTELAAGQKFDDRGTLPPGSKVSTFWVFNKAPNFDKDNREDRFAFTFDKLTLMYATGLQIARDPSTPWIYLGCFLLFAGIGIAFYMSHRRLWARLVDGKLDVYGASHRNQESFENEFARVCDDLGIEPKKRPAPRDPDAAPTPKNDAPPSADAAAPTPAPGAA
ncbi:MAG: cytochrome c biogenesis protein ResB [Deltaproteobacteria bacterium]|nr:cytochrome c biogenesis protein ResB [Deltaproteobacteria bacterium]